MFHGSGKHYGVLKTLNDDGKNQRKQTRKFQKKDRTL
jgi:hypothetical protein